MNSERLLKLADFLETNVSDDRFDLGFMWENCPDCGSVGCALAWGGICFKDNPNARLLASTLDPGNFYLSNSEDFFNLDNDELCYLFYGDSPYGWGITRLEEVELIRKFVRDGGILE